MSQLPAVSPPASATPAPNSPHPGPVSHVSSEQPGAVAADLEGARAKRAKTGSVGGALPAVPCTDPIPELVAPVLRAVDLNRRESRVRRVSVDSTEAVDRRAGAAAAGLECAPVPVSGTQGTVDSGARQARRRRPADLLPRRVSLSASHKASPSACAARPPSGDAGLGLGSCSTGADGDSCARMSGDAGSHSEGAATLLQDNGGSADGPRPGEQVGQAQAAIAGREARGPASCGPCLPASDPPGAHAGTPSSDPQARVRSDAVPSTTAVLPLRDRQRSVAEVALGCRAPPHGVAATGTVDGCGAAIGGDPNPNMPSVVSGEDGRRGGADAQAGCGRRKTVDAAVEAAGSGTSGPCSKADAAVVGALGEDNSRDKDAQAGGAWRKDDAVFGAGGVLRGGDRSKADAALGAAGEGGSWWRRRGERGTHGPAVGDALTLLGVAPALAHSGPPRAPCPPTIVDRTPAPPAPAAAPHAGSLMLGPRRGRLPLAAGGGDGDGGTADRCAVPAERAQHPPAPGWKEPCGGLVPAMPNPKPTSSSAPLKPEASQAAAAPGLLDGRARVFRPPTSRAEVDAAYTFRASVTVPRAPAAPPRAPDERGGAACANPGVGTRPGSPGALHRDMTRSAATLLCWCIWLFTGVVQLSCWFNCRHVDLGVAQVQLAGRHVC